MVPSASLKIVTNIWSHNMQFDDAAEQYAQHKEAIINQVTTMLSTSKNVLFPGHNHLLST